jgi:hypothetical protein
MLFPFLAASAASLGLMQLGSLYVWVQILGLTAKALLAMLAIGVAGCVVYVLWREYGNRQPAAKMLIEDKS